MSVNNPQMETKIL